MSATTFNPRSSRSFHLDGYEVTVDEIDMKLSEFENKGPRYQDGPTIMILPINIRINEHINVPGDIYIMGKEFGFTLYNVHDSCLFLPNTYLFSLKFSPKKKLIPRILFWTARGLPLLWTLHCMGLRFK